MKTYSQLFLFLSLFLFITTSCEKDDVMPRPTDSEPDPVSDFFTGWNPENEDLSKIPMAPNFGFSTENLPTRYDLTEYFPPIGDQGAYGTCVAWAVGYNVKTAISAMEKGLDPQALTQTQNQFSPKDLFISIPDAEKGGCDGTNFTSALAQLQDRGVASMATVPYESMGGCEQRNLQDHWTSEAVQNKIEYWRRIDPTVSSIKSKIANNIPVILGAKLADNFMTWNSDAVLSSNSSYDNVGIHAYHAMAIIGYDDSKGSNGAFRIINSWGPSWGDQGFIWIDYNFLVDEFCVTFNGGKPLFIAANKEGEGDVTPPEDTDPVSTSVDLAPWVFSDHSTYDTSGDPYERQVYMNIYNIGQSTASASDNWSVYYVYYNAYDINDYGVIFYDEFSNSLERNTYNCETYNHCKFNLDIPSGSDFAAEAFADESIYRTYSMPDLTGEYYLALIADGDDVYQEENEMNNIFYTSEWPIYFEQGYAALSKEGSKPSNPSVFEFDNAEKMDDMKLVSSVFNTSVNVETPNAYSSEEIRDFLRREKASGRLAAKIKNVETDLGNAIYSKESK
ncbi:C1 family peptidase [Membranihabitans maritimus]|uniref:C1 family peptidase n=1 Tax=Membranihabitans maritimus TaxID=2904244 RepID=UPI001F15DB96|nr:C1 family peptidase [Membranihabitans maritimus]